MNTLLLIKYSKRIVVVICVSCFAGCLGLREEAKTDSIEIKEDGNEWYNGCLNSLAFAPNGDLYVTEGGSIWRIDTDGFAHPCLSAERQLPEYVATALTVDRQGVVYVADRRDNVIVKVANSGVETRLGGQKGMEGFKDGSIYQSFFSQPNSIAVDEDGNLIVADTGNHAIRKVTPKGETKTLVGRISDSWHAYNTPGVDFNDNEQSVDGEVSIARFRNPWCVAVNKSGQIIVVSRISIPGCNENTVRIVHDGSVRTIAGRSHGAACVDGVGTNACFISLSSVAVDDNNNIFVSDAFAIRKITPDGVVSTFAGSNNKDGCGWVDGIGKMARFHNPAGLAFSSRGILFVADGNKIRKITPHGKVSTLRVKFDITEVKEYNYLLEMLRKGKNYR